MSAVLRVRVPPPIMAKLEEKARKYNITVEELLIRALVKIIEEG